MQQVSRSEIINVVRNAFRRDFPDEEPLVKEEADAVFVALLTSLRSSALRSAWEIRKTHPDRPVEVLQTRDGFATEWFPRSELISHVADCSGLDEAASGEALLEIEFLIRSQLRLEAKERTSQNETELQVAVENLGTITTSSPESRSYRITLSGPIVVSASGLPRAIAASA